MSLRILALEPYYGGSHRAFLDGWQKESCHQFTVLRLPAFHWKWRMRHAAITFAEQVRQLHVTGQRWDVLFASDMLNLAEFQGLVPTEIQSLPAILYYHENQLTYPARQPREWDYHFAFSNFVSGLAASECWFNSRFHQDDFLDALTAFLQRMPDHAPLTELDRIRAKSRIESPGVNLPVSLTGQRAAGPLRICWAARWEHDKAPEILQQALLKLQHDNLDFRISVLGESFKNSPSAFQEMESQFADRIDNWGYMPSHADYLSVLAETDVFVSTAIHEFFGISVVEAIAAGAYPLLPRRLAYPDVLELDDHPERREFFYDGSADQLAVRLGQLCRDPGSLRQHPVSASLRDSVHRFSWPLRATAMDAAAVRLSELTLSD